MDMPNSMQLLALNRPRNCFAWCHGDVTTDGSV